MVEIVPLRLTPYEYVGQETTAMDIALQSQFDRIDSALSTLVESFAAYNPSIPAANSLLAADDDLQTSLKHLVQHQKNHARILALHDKISQQNAEIISTLTTLADIRTDLLSASTSLPRKDARNVPFTELLDYAKRISRYTVPPTFRQPLNLPNPPPDSSAAVNGDAAHEEEGEEDGIGMGTEALEDEEKKWLEPLMQIPFAPWVSDEVMRRGALAQIQAMVERGEDPANVKPEGSGEADGSGKVGGEMAEVQNENIVGGRQGERRQENRATKPEVFGGLDLYDPSNPDEDG